MQTAEKTDLKALLLSITRRVHVDKYGASYVSAIADLSTEDDLRCQASYILGNSCLPESGDEKLARAQLKAFAEGNPIPAELAHSAPSNVLTDVEAEAIMLDFERATERRVDRGDLITMSDAERFAERKHIPVDHVLACTDWSDECFDAETLSAIKNAKKTVIINRDWRRHIL